MNTGLSKLTLETSETDTSLSVTLNCIVSGLLVTQKSFQFTKGDGLVKLGGDNIMKKYKLTAFKDFIQAIRARQAGTYAMSATESFQYDPSTNNLTMTTQTDGVTTTVVVSISDSNASKLLQLATLIESASVHI